MGFSKRLGELLREGFLRGLNQTGEGLGIVDGDLGEHLAVDGDLGFLETAHELGVGDVVDAASGIDPLDPKFAVVALDEATGIVRVTERVTDLLFGGFEEEVLGAEIAFSSLQDLFATGTGNGATFDSSHCVDSPSLFDDHELDATIVGAIKHSRAAKLTGLLRGLVGGVVALVGVNVFHFTVAGNFDSLH